VKKQRPTEKKAILKNLDGLVTRIRVLDKDGKQRWRKRDQVKDSDRIELNAAGQPHVMRGKPGRAYKPNIEAVSATVKELKERKSQSIATNPLVKAVADTPNSPDVLQYIMQGMATEAASLAFERSEAERKGEGTSTISTRMITAYNSIANTWLKRMEQLGSGGSLELDSPGTQALLAFLFETVREAMAAAGLRREMADTIFANMAAKMNDKGWESEARRRIKNA